VLLARLRETGIDPEQFHRYRWSCTLYLGDSLEKP
jgi:hypothetical protein